MNWYHPLTRVVVEALLNSLWGGILLSVAVICLLQIFRRTSAQTRFAIWWLTLLAVIGLPLLFGFSMRGRKHPLVHSNNHQFHLPRIQHPQSQHPHTIRLPSAEKSSHIPKRPTARADVSEAVHGKDERNGPPRVRLRGHRNASTRGEPAAPDQTHSISPSDSLHYSGCCLLSLVGSSSLV